MTTTKTSREYRQEAADARERAARATAPGAREHILKIAANLDKHADALEARQAARMARKASAS